MPRRPRKQPRASNGVTNARKTSARTGDAKVKKWVRREDIEGDEEDQFHDTRDRILLEGEDVEGEEEWGDGEEEVFGLGLEGDSEDEEEDEGGEPHPSDSESEKEGHGLTVRKSKRAKTPRTKPSPSSPNRDSSSDESESWGRTKSAYYASNASMLAGKEGESDEEEAHEMEEREARRLQARQREAMTDEDYGLNGVVDMVVEDTVLEDEPVAAVLSAPTLQLDKAAALRHLEKTSPETLALAREWDDVARDLVRVQERIDKIASTTPEASSLGLSHMHHQTLLTYVTTLAFYLHLRSTPHVASQVQTQTPARIKPVLARLLKLKQALAIMEELNFDASDEEDDEEDSDLDEESLDEDELAQLLRTVGARHGRVLKEDMSEVWGRGRKKKLEAGELEELLRDVDTPAGTRPRKKAKGTQRDTNATSEEVHYTTNGVNPGVNKPPKARITKDKRSNTPLKPKLAFDLVEPEFVPSTRAGTRAGDNEKLDAYGEATALSMADDADKKSRKRSLRFHTSKIETSARRREEGREKLGGDDDIPYRERKKEKEARVRREVDKTRGEGGVELDVNGDMEMEGGVAPGPGKRKRGEDDVSDEAGEDGYYELVKQTKKEKKEEKKREYKEARMAERIDIMDDGPGGPRSLTRAILKNKGLTPRRAKSVRNPRVKKRERFEKAKKKVRSQKAMYKGGLSGKPYGGEESGITKVVKSVKL